MYLIFSLYSLFLCLSLSLSLSQAAKNHSSNPDDLRFYFPGYVWITLGWYSDQWWTAEVANDPLTDCRDEQLEELFLPQTLGILQANSASDEKAQTDVMLVNSLL